MTKKEVDELNAGVKRFYAQNPKFPAGTKTHCARMFRGSTAPVHTCTGGPYCKGLCKPKDKS